VEIEVELPNDLSKYIGSEEELYSISSINHLTKMQLLHDVNNALQHYGMEGCAINATKIGSRKKVADVK
jgi:hypothetical protein